METEIRLTKLANCAGCGAKVGGGVLAQLLGDLKVRRDENLLVSAETSIKNADVIVFGGAPLFNWHHQNFYERRLSAAGLSHQAVSLPFSDGK